MPKKATKRAVKKSNKVEEPEVHSEPESAPDSLPETGSESEELPLSPPKLKRQPRMKNIIEEEKANQPEKKQRKAPSARKPRAPSLWLKCLQEQGYMCKGGEFKPTPKKGTKEYDAVRKVFEEMKAQA